MTDTQRSTPVVIIGGGPVGLAAALELAHHDVASVVVETRPDVSWLRPRAKTTSARTMEHFRRWGIAATVRDRAPLKPAWSNEVVFCTTVLGREVARFDRCFGLHLIHDELVSEGGQQAPQPLIEEIMRERVRALPHVDLITGWTVTALEQDERSVVVSLTDGAGTSTIRSDYALGCDGPKSIARDSIGARLIGSDDSRPNFNMVFQSDALAARIPHGNAIHYWVLNPNRPGVVGPLDLHGRFWCIAMGVDHEQGNVDPVALVRSLLGDDLADLAIDVIATDPWRARMQLTDRFGLGRVFLAGDAAHLNPPWGGHGFNTGIGDAANIGWKLAAVIQGWAPASLLDSYEIERRPVADETIAVAAKNMATLSPELTDERLMGTAEEFATVHPIVDATVQRTKYGEFHSLGLVLGTSYHSSPIVAIEPTEGGPAAFEGDDYQPSATPGSRLPHHWLRADLSLYDAIGPEHSLVGDLSVPGATRIVDEAARLGIPLTTVGLSSALARQLFDAALVLVRPDQHVAWRGTEPEAVRQLLLQVTGHGSPTRIRRERRITDAT